MGKYTQAEDTIKGGWELRNKNINEIFNELTSFLPDKNLLEYRKYKI